MSGAAHSAEQAIEFLGRRPGNHALMQQFLQWQCRVRQIAMREQQGRPDDAIMPAVYPLEKAAGKQDSLGHIITVISKWGAHSKTPELRHMVQKTNDPAQRREDALRFLAAGYYQSAREFSDTLTATFAPGSTGALALLEANRCTLVFEAYSQRFELVTEVMQLSRQHPLFEATWWHNSLFNPELPPDTIILGFQPDWEYSSAESLVT